MALKPDYIMMLNPKPSRVLRILNKIAKMRLRQESPQPFSDKEVSHEDREHVWKAMQEVNNFAFGYYNDCRCFKEVKLKQSDYDEVFTEVYIKSIPFFVLLPNIHTDIKEVIEGCAEDSFSFIGNDGDQFIKYILID